MFHEIKTQIGSQIIGPWGTICLNFFTARCLQCNSVCQPMERNNLFVSANLQGTDSGGKRKNYCSTTVEKEMGVNLAAGLELKTLISLFAFSSSYSVKELIFSNENNYTVISAIQSFFFNHTKTHCHSTKCCCFC